MNEQDKKLLELYVKDIRKKKIFFCGIVILFIAVILFCGVYTNYKQSLQNTQNDIANIIQEEIQNNIINENNTNENTTSNIENSINEIQEDKNNEVEEITQEDNITQDKKEETKENNKNTTSKEKEKEKNTSEKPANKDFLFTDGYTMDNVTQAAEDYLKSYNLGGECIPIKDNEGVYLGMRVIFY